MNFSAKKMFFIDLLITIIGVLFDQFTKHLAVLCLKDQAPVSLIPGALELRYLENRHGTTHLDWLSFIRIAEHPGIADGR